MDGFDKYYNKALRFLSFRPRSEKEVRDNLIKRTFRETSNPVKAGASRINIVKDSGFTKAHQNDDKIIDQVIAKLKDQNLINDEEFARWWIEQRTTFRPLGLGLIKLELRQKGIDQEIIESQVSNISGLAGQIPKEPERAKELIKKRLLKYKGLEKKEIYQKLGQFLARRGFDFETIKEAVDDIFKKGV